MTAQPSAKRQANQEAKRLARLEAIRVVFENRDRINDHMLLRAMLDAVIRRHKIVQWTTDAARALGAGAVGKERHVDHVVPVQILIDRMLDGADPDSVMAMATCCYVTREEHQSDDLLGKFRHKHADLRKKMQTCAIGDLRELGWERYRRAWLTWEPTVPTMDDSNAENGG